MKAIVFGGSGFLGSHVADALTDDGYDVVIYDLTHSPYLKDSQKMVIGDIMDERAVIDAVKGCEIVYNFAGIADIDEALNKPIDTVKLNILGNTNILEAARLNNIKRFVFASSVYVYSQSGGFYRASKQSCELFIENFQKIFGIPFTILRYGSLYGPRADFRNWIYQIIYQALISGKISRYGDGEEIREYIHVEDAARGSVEVLKSEYENQYVILSGHQSIKVKELLTMIKEMLGNNVVLEYLPPKENTHYAITPYSFNPKIGKKLVSHYYLDMGQGIMACIEDIYSKISRLPKESGVLIEKEKDLNGR